MTALTASASGVVPVNAATVWAHSADLEELLAGSPIALTLGPRRRALVFADGQRRWEGSVVGLGEDGLALERSYHVRAAHGSGRFSCLLTVRVTGEGDERSSVAVHCTGSSTDASTGVVDRLTDAWHAAVISQASGWKAAPGRVGGGPGMGRGSGAVGVSWYGATAAAGAGVVVGAVLSMLVRRRR